MNQYPLWKNLLILAVVLISCLYALPNLYGDDPAVQISAGRQGKVDAALLSQAETALKAASLEYKQAKIEDGRLLIRFASEGTQLKAKDVLTNGIKGDYIVALNLAPTTPTWLRDIGAEPMNLGLDLRGGVHFLMQVDMDAVIKQTLNSYASDIRVLLRDNKIRYKQIKVEKGVMDVVFRTNEHRDQARQELEKEYNQLKIAVAEDASEPTLQLTLTKPALLKTEKLALQQNITTLRNRINELGVAEPTVQQQGQDRIVVELPGVQDTAQAKKILGATATLEFRLVDTEHDVKDALAGRVPPNSEIFYNREGQPFLLKKRVMLTGEHIIDAASTIDSQSGTPAVSVTLDGKGARAFSNATRDNIGKPMAVVFIESKSETKEVNGEKVQVRKQVPEIINVATIRDQLSKKFQITGLDNTTEAHDLALLLRAGALAAPIQIVEERTVGPSLGQDNIDKGFQSVVLGFVLVLIFMVLRYRVFGMVANVALIMNLVMIVALLSIIQATLTLPGIAGMVLTVGMAVDANVLIYERIREELRLGNSPQTSISAGFGKAFSTIADANITTLLTALLLFGFGSGSIKGFAVTLSLGIATSVFTATTGTRAIINLIYGRKHRPKLSI